MKNAEVAYSTKTYALGGGEWSIEVEDEFGNFLAEFVGNNGCKNAYNPEGEKDDLWARVDEWMSKDYKGPESSYSEYARVHGR